MHALTRPHPSPLTSRRVAASQLTKTLPQLDALDEEACDRLIEKLSHIVKVRQLYVRPTFDDRSKNPNSPFVVRRRTAARGHSRSSVRCPARSI